MKNILFLISILSLSLFMTSCDREDDTVDAVVYEYHAHVHTPNTDDKHVNDPLEIEVEFESHAGEAVHHINVRIYNKADGTEIYNKPADAHVHEIDGELTYQDMMMLTNANGVEAHSDWILEASVWGAENRTGEVIETVEFHVHPE